MLLGEATSPPSDITDSHEDSSFSYSASLTDNQAAITVSEEEAAITDNEAVTDSQVVITDTSNTPLCSLLASLLYM